MKTMDLMPGDWVNVFDIPKQIEGIKKFQNGDEIVYYDGDNGNFIENVTPIPLTSDILEQNGWILKEWNGHKQFQYIFNECGTDIMLKIDYEVPNFLIVCFREEISIRYVHELQHLLKLCKIEKEIIL